MNLKLLRLESFRHHGTIGRLYLGEQFICYTLEREWKNNSPFESCVPTGLYKLETHESAKYGRTFALIGDTVSHFKSNKERYAILIHPANFQKDLAGCIAPGMALDAMSDKIMVTQSKNAFARLMGILDNSDHLLSIEDMV